MTNTQRLIQFCPYCGIPVKNKPTCDGVERPTCPSCNWRYFPDPKVASAALVEDNGKVLLVCRLYDPYKGKWSLPAGFVNAYEDPAQAAERECLEETGLIVQASELFQVFSGREHSYGADIFMVYKAKVTGGNLQAGDDAEKAAFFFLNNLPPLAFHTTIQVLKNQQFQELTRPHH